MTTELKNMNITGVHLVGSPAIRKKFIIVKSEEGMSEKEQADAKAKAEEAEAKSKADAEALAKAESDKTAAEEAKKVAEEALSAKDAALIKSALDILKSSNNDSAKSAAEELEAAMSGKKIEKSSKATSEEVQEILKSILPEVTKSAQEPVMKALEETKTQLEEIKKSNAALVAEKTDREINEIADKLVGDKTENLDFVRSMKSELSEEAFSKFVDREVKKAAEIRKSAAFTEVGSSKATSASDNAYEQLKKMADEKVSKSEGKMAFNEAFNASLLENPALYNQYRNNSYDNSSTRED